MSAALAESPTRRAPARPTGAAGHLDWSADEDRALRMMREAGMSFAECGDALDRSKESCRVRLAKIEDRAARAAMSAPKAKERRCLCGCGARFMSRHAGERIRPECRGSWSGRTE